MKIDPVKFNKIVRFMLKTIMVLLLMLVDSLMHYAFTGYNSDDVTGQWFWISFVVGIFVWLAASAEIDKRFP